MKKKWWLIGFATLAIAGALVVAIPTLQPLRPGVTKANFDRIEEGMSISEVEAILGEHKRNVDLLVLVEESATLSLMHYTQWWRNENGSNVRIIFSNDDIVIGKTWAPSTETITDKLRRWLSFPRK